MKMCKKKRKHNRDMRHATLFEHKRVLLERKKSRDMTVINGEAPRGNDARAKHPQEQISHIVVSHL